MSEKTCGCYYGNRDGVLGECEFPPHHQGPHSWEAPAPVRSAESPEEKTPLDRVIEALEFSHGAILDAIGLEDGLDAVAGQRVLMMIRDALVANGRQPLPFPDADAEVDPQAFWSSSASPEGSREALEQEFARRCSQTGCGHGTRRPEMCRSCAIDIAVAMALSAPATPASVPDVADDDNPFIDYRKPAAVSVEPRAQARDDEEAVDFWRRAYGQKLPHGTISGAMIAFANERVHAAIAEVEREKAVLKQQCADTYEAFVDMRTRAEAAEARCQTLETDLANAWDAATTTMQAHLAKAEAERDTLRTELARVRDETIAECAAKATDRIYPHATTPYYAGWNQACRMFADAIAALSPKGA